MDTIYRRNKCMHIKSRKLISLILCLVIFTLSSNSTCLAVNPSEFAHMFKQSYSECEMTISKTTAKDVELLRPLLESNFEINPVEVQYLSFGGSKNELINDMFTVSPEDCNFTINYKGKVAGQITISREDDGKEFNVSYWLNKEFRGNGLIVKATLKIMAEMWQFNKDVSFKFTIDDANIPSKRTVEKIEEQLKADIASPCGYKFEFSQYTEKCVVSLVLNRTTSKYTISRHCGKKCRVCSRGN